MQCSNSFNQTNLINVLDSGLLNSNNTERSNKRLFSSMYVENIKDELEITDSILIKIIGF